jgi:glycosyltransferase involved in cell wall biosynthesis
MKIGIVHSYYSTLQPSGENSIVDLQVSALRAAGHDVRLYARSTIDESKRTAYSLRAALTTATGLGAAPDLGGHEWKPDILHIHNLFPNFGTRWLETLQLPYVISLHNYRPLCAAATLEREGRTCLDCVDKGAHHALLNRCYRGSAIATAPLYIQNRRGLRRNKLIDNAQHVLVLSKRSREVFSSAGLPDNKMTVVPNPCEDREETGTDTLDPGWLYVGRLSGEKGIEELLQAWPSHERLTVVGGGPLHDRLPRSANVQFLGARSPNEVRAMMSRFQGLIFPSRWFEGAPLVYPEALSAGLPVVALRGNGVADAIEVEETGVVLGGLSTSHIAAMLDRVRRVGPSLRRKCRVVYETTYTVDAWVSRLEAVYEKAGAH